MFPWFLRSGGYGGAGGTGAGLFTFGLRPGCVVAWVSFRVVSKNTMV